MLRLLVVFVHVCGAMGLFGAAAIEGASLLHVNRQGGVAVARQGFALARRVGSLGAALLLLSGLFLTQTVWGWRTAWIDVSMLAFVVMMGIGGSVSRHAMPRLGETSDAAGVREVLVRSFIVRASILIGVVFLMTVKPPLTESLVAVSAAAGIGFLAGLPSGRRRAVPTA